MGYALVCEPNDLEDGRTRFHRFRYHLAKGFVDPLDRVLDLGCGTGYGSDILSEVTLDVTGFDKEESNIEYARRHHEGACVMYNVADIENMLIPEAEVAVSFEVIEHLYKPKEFVDKLKKQIKRFIIVSVPLGQELVWVPELNEYQEKGDSTHHSVFASPDEFKAMFLDDDWKEYYSFRDGVTYIAIFYRHDITENTELN